MNKHMKIGVLQGGFSKEKNVSLKTAKAITHALQKDGFTNVVAINVQNNFVPHLIQEQLDIAVNALHGSYGEDGGVQGLLDSLNIPYTGAGLEASALCMNKYVSKLIFCDHNIPTADHSYIEENTALSEVEAKAKDLGFPLVIKPSHEGSTFGLKIVMDERTFKQDFIHCLDFAKTFVLEKFIKGREITVAVLNGKALPIVEIKPKNGFYDYEAKYTEGKTDFSCPAKFEESVAQVVMHQAEKVAKVMGASHFSRVDMIYAQGKAWVLEINTLPGMTPTSLFPLAAKTAGISFPELLQQLLKQALERKVSYE